MKYFLMGLFSKSDSMNSKAKIEELKKKIAEESVAAPAPPPAPAPPQQEPQQMEQFAQQQIQQIDQQVATEPVQQSIDLDHGLQEKEVGHMDGVILDIGNGMSLNLPIRPRMKLEEFLEIADKVKELKRINFG